jgi:pimeloyl-ACP methyl ester carboxylesterase
LCLSILATLLVVRYTLQKQADLIYGVNTPKGIDRLERIQIGGVEQWIHIRGRDTENPVLLFLHDGPAAPQSIGWFDAIQRPWEDYFTVVQWDQRQTGKNYYPVVNPDNKVTINLLVHDLEEIVFYLRNTLKKDKVVIVGHSWGGLLGAKLAQTKPEWVSVFVGIGLTPDPVENERVLYERMLKHAQQGGNTSLIKQLKDIDPYLDPQNKVASLLSNALFLREGLNGIAGEAGMRGVTWNHLWRSIFISNLISPHVSIKDLLNKFLSKGSSFGHPVYGFAEEALSEENIIGEKFDVPIFLFTGEHDWQSPRVLTEMWYEKIEAPHKQLVNFNRSTHFIFNEEPGEFLMALVNKVLPYAQHQVGLATCQNNQAELLQNVKDESL